LSVHTHVELVVALNNAMEQWAIPIVMCAALTSAMADQ